MMLGRSPRTPGGRVIDETDAPFTPGPFELRTPIHAAVGSRNLHQQILRLHPRVAVEIRNEDSEEAIYVAAGSGSAIHGAVRLVLKSGASFFIPPATHCLLQNVSETSPLILVSNLSPQPGSSANPGMSFVALALPDRVKEIGTLSGRPAIAMTNEGLEDSLPAGDDRYFKLMIDPRYGAQHITQFVGFIDRSRAPFHTHTYEEAIYILEGEGIVHIEGQANHPIMPGTSIFLPPGTPHCLENASRGVLKLLGVFSPPGSPASKVEDRP